MAKKLIPFEPVPIRPRRDGWTPKRQTDFIEALASCCCVDEASKRVGMHRSTAYDLRARKDAASFRAAWEAALDHGIQRLSDAAFSRAIRGVSRPVFYKGEQIGERLYFDERLTMFLLRYRDPYRYGRWRDRTEIQIPEDGIARYMWHQIDRAERDARDDIRGTARTMPPPVTSIHVVADTEHEAGSTGRNARRT